MYGVPIILIIALEHAGKLFPFVKIASGGTMGFTDECVGGAVMSGRNHRDARFAIFIGIVVICGIPFCARPWWTRTIVVAAAAEQGVKNGPQDAVSIIAGAAGR